MAVVALAAIAVGLSLSVAQAASGGTGIVPITAPKACGQSASFQHPSSGVLTSLPKTVQHEYSGYPYSIDGTPWAAFKGIKGPWKIGYVSFPIGNSWQIGLHQQLVKDFAELKAKGIVQGTLQTYIQPSFSTATPEQQEAAISQMVKSGVNGILVQGLNSLAEKAAYDAAGKAGVPVVGLADISPFSKYFVNFEPQNNFWPIAKVLGQVKKGNILIVRGAPGVATEQAYYDGWLADIKACPSVKVVGTLWGQWSATTTKTQVLEWLTSHPGVQVSAVFDASGISGVIEAFQEAGRPIPVITFAGSTGGDRTWWLDHKSTYTTYGQWFTGSQTATTAFRILLRILGGKGLKVRDIAIPGNEITNANIAESATPNEPLTWVSDVTNQNAPPLITNEGLNAFFKKPGTPGGL
jgi:ribose transport system substrate-binding protein